MLGQTQSGMREMVAAAGNPAGYRRLLRGLMEAGYRGATFCDFDAASAQVILRHDVDLSLELAAEMALLEAEEGWRATYFVLPGTQFYNPASRRSREAMRQMQALGHEIGLHFDPMTCADRGESGSDDLEKAAEAECAWLEDLLGTPVRVTAFHRPGAFDTSLLNRPGFFAGRPHAYEPRFFSEIGYVSESMGDWTYGHPLDHLAVAERRGMQLLTHPYLWMHAMDGSQMQKIEWTMRRNDAAMRGELSRNFRTYVPVAP